MPLLSSVQVCPERLRWSELAAGLLLHSNKFSAAGIHRDTQPGIVAAVAINHVPDQLIGGAAPVERVQDRCTGIFFQNFIPAVLLRDLQSFVGVDLKESDIEDRCRGVVGAVGIFGARGNPARRSIRSVGARPYIRLYAPLRGRSECRAPYVSFAVFSFGIGGELRFQPEWLGIA